MTESWTQPQDRLGRRLRDMRISVTDRCNFRCTYCMPREVFGPSHAFLETSALLSFEEIEEVVRAGKDLGVRKVRLTGGEPLLRKNICGLVARLSAVGGLDIAMTTNGVLLPRLAQDLASSGLNRVTVSLDSLNDDTFRRASDSKYRVQDVLAGMDAAEAAGLGRVKINMVVKKGLNDGDILEMAGRFRGTDRILRFIEFMDVGDTNAWEKTNVLTAQEIVHIIADRYPIEPIEASYTGEVATKYRYKDGLGEIGIITSISQPFCGSCTRARISADGSLYTCLFASSGFDLRTVLRGARRSGDLHAALSGQWTARDDRYSEIREIHEPGEKRIEMSYIGG